MQIIWSKNADRQMYLISLYIQKQFGTKRKKEFLREVRQTTNLLKRNPELGPPDPLFKECNYVYRSIIINGLNKLVYYINNDVIYISAFWDTRREPECMANELS